MSHVILFITAIDVEHQAMLEHLRETENVSETGTQFIRGRTRKSGREAILARTDQGNVAAAETTQKAIGRFSPSLVIFSGIAGALQERLQLGDIVIADQITTYGGGLSENDAFLSRPGAWRVPHAEQQLARTLADSQTWQSYRPPSAGQVLIGHVASGEVVLNSRTSDIAKRLLENHNDALAIEMEGAGVARAAHASGVPFLIVRAISDRADGTKYRTDRGNARTEAAAAAAAFAAMLGDELPLNRSAGARPDEEKSPEEHTKHQISQNVWGGARVGTMVGLNQGDIVSTTEKTQPSISFDAELSRLRNLLKDALAEGRISHQQHQEACFRLDDAEHVLPPQDSGQKDLAVFFFHRLLEIGEGVADLGPHVNRITEAIKGTAA